MEELPNLDGLLGGLAIAIFLAGMLMLVGGVGSLDDDKDKKNKGKKKGEKSDKSASAQPPK